METEPPLTDPPLPQAATRGVLITAAANALLAVIALATGVLAARLLGPAARGHLAAAQAIGTLVGALGALALGEALVFSIGRRTRRPMVVLRTAALVAIGPTVTLIVLAWAIMPSLLAGQPDAVAAARAYALVGVPFVLLGFPISLLRALQRYGLWNVVRLVTPLCWLAALLWATMDRSRAVAPLVITFIFLQMLFVPIIWMLARKQDRGPARIDFGLVRPMLSYGAPLLLATLPHALNVRLDQLVLANMETAEQLGLYAVSVSWAGLGLPLMTAIGSVLFPKLATMGPSDAREMLARSSRAGVLAAVVIGAASALTAPVVVPWLFGRVFAVPILLPLMLAAAAAVLGLNGVIEEGLRGLGEPRSVLVGELVGLGATGLLLLTLVPRVGIAGAAVASLGGYSMVTATLAWRIRSRLDVRVSDLLVPRATDLRDLAARARAVRSTMRGRVT